MGSLWYYIIAGVGGGGIAYRKRVPLSYALEWIFGDVHLKKLGPWRQFAHARDRAAMLKPCADQVNALCGLVPDTEEFEPSREAMRDQTGRLLAEFEVLIERTFEARERLALLQEDQNADSAWMVIKLMITRQEIERNALLDRLGELMAETAKALDRLDQRESRQALAVVSKMQAKLTGLLREVADDQPALPAPKTTPAELEPGKPTNDE